MYKNVQNGVFPIRRKNSNESIFSVGTIYLSSFS